MTRAIWQGCYLMDSLSFAPLPSTFEHLLDNRSIRLYVDFRSLLSHLLTFFDENRLHVLGLGGVRKRAV